MRRSAFVATLCGLALAGAGCGGDDDDNKSLSYDDTGTEIGKICDSVPDSEELGLTGNAKKDKPALDKGVEAFEKAIADTEELDVDDELAEDRDAFVANGKEQLEIAKELQSAAGQGDDEEYRRVAEDSIPVSKPLSQEGDEIASRLGADACID